MLVVLGVLGGWLGSRAASGASATALAGGAEHTCALTSRGTVQCWGRNRHGQLGDGTTTDRWTPVTVAGLSSGILAVSAGEDHTCALTSGGAVRCWGHNGYGQLGDGTTTDRWTPATASGLESGVLALSVGWSHTCAVTSAGAVRCWGRNDYGQLGDGTTTNRSAPVAVSGLGSGIAAVTAGGYHTCAVTSGGGVQCWGYNGTGQLGDGTTTDRLTTVAVTGLTSGVSAVATGRYHTCALTTGEAVRCWGYNNYGQLGDGTTTTRTTWVAVSGLASGVTALTAGWSHTCALGLAGVAQCWGYNYFGQIGDGTTANRTTPVTVTGLTSAVGAVAAGGYHACAITSSGVVQCWGRNYYGQLGDGTTTERWTPVTATGLAGGEVMLSAGAAHTCGLTSSGGAQCWGYNGSGQLGDGTTTTHVMPAPVSGLASGVVSVIAGNSHTCALTSGGGVQCWGYNGYGQIGDGTTTQRPTPVPVSGLASGVEAVAAGSGHTCAVTGGGAVWCWGRNASGQIGDGTTTQRAAPVPVSGLASGAVAVAAASAHTCAVTSGGAVQCWGINDYGQLGDGTTTPRLTPVAVSSLSSGVVAVAAGMHHTCALTSSGVVQCWGLNNRGQLGDGTTANRLTPVAVSGLTSGVAAVAAGPYHTCALTSGAGVQCWGANYNGELGDGTTTNRTTPVVVSGLESGASAITGGGNHTCGLANGVAVCWGSNAFGQLGDGTTTTRLTPVVVGVHRPGQDQDGDGTSDVVWRHATGGGVWLWPMAGTTINSQDYLGVVGDTGWVIRGRGDQTGDGKADLLWRHATTGMIYLWTMDGATIVSVSYVGTVDPAFDIVGVGDYSGDSKSDILWRHTPTGELWLWRMNDATISAVSLVATVDPAYAVVASGDVNADGKADIVWRHTATGDVWVWLMNGATPISQAYLATVADPDYQVAGLADCTGDGKADLLWWHATTGDVWLWTLNGTALTSVAYVATVTDTAYRLVGTGDYDGDGMADALWHHATRGEVWVWLMDGATITSATWISTVGDVGYRIVNPR